MMRFALLTLLVLACAFGCDRKTAAAPAQGPVKVKIALNWVPEPEFGGIYAAGQMGLFKARGIEARIMPGGAGAPRDLPVPGRELNGIHFAMDVLPLQNRRVAGERDVAPLTAKGKRVVVIGGGDTGSDCVGTSIRQGAK